MYCSEIHSFKLDSGKTIYVRAKVVGAYLPGIGQVNFPEYLAKQEEIQKALAAAKKAKKPAEEILQLENQLTAPAIFDDYLDSNSISSIFSIADKKTDLESVEEIALDAEALQAENENLKARIAELEAKESTTEKK